MLRHYTIGIGIGENRHGIPISPNYARDIVASIESYLADRFDGFTTIATQGGWVNLEGRLVREPGYSFHILTDQSDREVYKSANWVGWIAQQHSIVLILPSGYAEILPVKYED